MRISKEKLQGIPKRTRHLHCWCFRIKQTWNVQWKQCIPIRDQFWNGNWALINLIEFYFLPFAQWCLTGRPTLALYGTGSCLSVPFFSGETGRPNSGASAEPAAGGASHTSDLCVNDPSRRLPMETLLWLLLHLNDRVRSSSLWHRRRSHKIIQSVIATSGVYKGQERNHLELMTRTYWEFLVHGERLQAPIASTKEVQRVALAFRPVYRACGPGHLRASLTWLFSFATLKTAVPLTRYWFRRWRYCGYRKLSI